MSLSRHTKLFLGSIATLLYFSEGMPFGIVKDLVPVYLRVNHVDLTSIGLLNVVGFAWVFKFAWSPLVDTFGTYRRWIAGALVAIAVVLGLAAATAGAVIGAVFYTAIALLAIASATQDIAVDAFTIRATPSELVGPINSIRVTAYRAALILGGGGLAALGGRVGWRAAFGAAAMVALAILAMTLILPDDRGQRSEHASLITDLKHWLTRPRASLLLSIVFLYRVGEFAIVSMIKPYWVDRGYSPAEIGTITSVIGVIVSVIGAIAGGAIVAHLGLWKSLLWLGIAQTLSNTGYAVVATINAGRWAIYAAAILENFGFGLGTAAFLAYLMSICDRERAATEYAALSAAYAATGNLIASVSGIIAQHAGYTVYFWITVLLGLPSLFLLPAIRVWLSPTELPIAQEKPVIETS